LEFGVTIPSAYPHLFGASVRPAAPQQPGVIGRPWTQVSTTLGAETLEAVRDDAAALQKSLQTAPAFPFSLLPSLRRIFEGLLKAFHWPTPAPPAPPAPPAASPKPVKPSLPVGGREPETRIIAEQPYSRNMKSAIQKMYKAEAKRQSARARLHTGVTIGGGHDKAHRRIRTIAAQSKAEQAIAAKATHKTKTGWQGPNLTNPNDPSGRFDPHAFQPTWVFDTKEDSFPVRPDYDGDRKVGNDLEHYKHGVIGGKQALEGAFSVAQKGEYTVLTYSLNYVDNKYRNYHEGDSSTVSVYLKKNAKGKLEPAYVYTSAHYHGTLTPWKDLKKDAQGHPIIRVERGSHALHPYGVKEKIPADGLHIAADGHASMNGKSLPNRMTWVTHQKNLKNTVYLAPDKAQYKPVWNRYFSAYPERREPFHPSLFRKH
jgi:hypothetical protein